MRRRIRTFGLMAQRLSNIINVKGNIKFFNEVEVGSGGIKLNDGSISVNQGHVIIKQGDISISQGSMVIKGQLEIAGNQNYDATNIAIGRNALLNHNSLDNIAIGKDALKSLDIQQRNIAIGSRVMQNLNSGEGRNTVVGIGASSQLVSGGYNTSLGYQALVSNQIGSYNTVIGCQAGYSINGSGNVMLGYQAGYQETGSNKLYIANSNTTTPLIYGEFPNTRLNLNAQNVNFGNVTIETTAGAITNYAILEFGGTQYKIALYALS
jgi:hypothetical protein